MGLDSARAAVEARVLANWTADGTALLTPVAFANGGGVLTTVDGLSGLPAPREGEAWIRCTLIEGGGQQKNLGLPALVRVVGLIEFQCFVPIGSGSAGARVLADRLVPIFETKIFDGIHTGARQPAPVGVDGQWWQYNVGFPYWRNESNA